MRTVTAFFSMLLICVSQKPFPGVLAVSIEEDNEDGRVLIPDAPTVHRPKSLELPPLTSRLEDTFTHSDSVREGFQPNELFFNTAECGHKKGCLFKPKGCIPHTNCTYAFSYRSDAQRVYMELLGQLNSDSNAFVAVGFSADALMGNDTVTDCSSFEGEPFAGRLSFNPGKTNRNVPIGDSTRDQMLTTHLAQFKDGTLYCKLSQNIVPLGNLPSYYVRPLNQSYRVFLSSGSTDNRQLTVHSLDTKSVKYPFISGSNIMLTDFHQMEAVDFSASSVGSQQAVLLGAPSNTHNTLQHEEHVENEQTDEHFNDEDQEVGISQQGRRRDEQPGGTTTARGPMVQVSQEEAGRRRRLMKAHGSEKKGVLLL